MTDRDIVISIDKEDRTTAGMTDTFSATAAAGVISSQSRTVTMMMINYP